MWRLLQYSGGISKIDTFSFTSKPQKSATVSVFNIPCVYDAPLFPAGRWIFYIDLLMKFQLNYNFCGKCTTLLSFSHRYVTM